MKQITAIALSLMLLAAASSASAVALPDNAPDYRGDPNSVYAQWTSVTAADYQPAETFTNGGGIYPLDVTNLFQNVACGDGEPCLHPVGGAVGVYMPNFVDPLPRKRLRLQATWIDILGDGFAGPPVGAEAWDPVVDPDNFGILFPPTVPTLVFGTTDTYEDFQHLGGNLYYGYIDFIWHSNPD